MWHVAVAHKRRSQLLGKSNILFLQFVVQLSLIWRFFLFTLELARLLRVFYGYEFWVYQELLEGGQPGDKYEPACV